MKKYIDNARLLILSSTARDTYVLFGGNLLSAFLGFVFTYIVSSALTKEDFGIFSAATNLIVILISITDMGISSGSVNFVSTYYAQKDEDNSNKYIKASVVLRLAATLIACLVMVIFIRTVSETLLATSDYNITLLTVLTTLALALPMTLPYILQAQKRFWSSIIADNSLYLSRLIFTILFMVFARVTVGNSLLSFILGGLVGTIVGMIYVKFAFLKSKPNIAIYKNLIKFSGWLGVNRIISSISGRLDIQMLIVLLGATPTGLYSIASKISGLLTVLTSSFSSVLAPRLTSFSNKEDEKKYIIKATFALIPIVLGILVVVAFSRQFLYLIWGEKFLESTVILQALLLSSIPFLLTAPSVAVIIYSMKKNIYIGTFSFFQLAAIFFLNLVLIPKYGVLGPTITLTVTNTILAIYTWVIVIKYYWFTPKKS